MQSQLLILIFSIHLVICQHFESSQKRLYQYKICQESSCKEVKSYTPAEYLFDLDTYLYSQWSIWSPCNKWSCSTGRNRGCRYPSICGNTVVFEEAFCYTPGTRCEEIFLTNRQEFVSAESNEKMTKDNYEPIASSTNANANTNIKSRPKQKVQQAISEIFRNFEQKRNSTRLDPVEPVRVPVSIPVPIPIEDYYTNSQRYDNHGYPPAVPVPTDPEFENPQEFPDYSYYNSDYESSTGPFLAKLNQGECGVAKIPQDLLDLDPNDIRSGQFDRRRRRRRRDRGHLKSRRNKIFMTKILGGEQSVKGRWPWQVAIINSLQEAYCAGTLIFNRWILTAAHCVRRKNHVVIGDHNLLKFDGTERHYNIKLSFIHPNFNPETVDSDIALLMLPEKIPDADIACLPSSNEPLPVSTDCTILGWGKEKSNHVFGTTVLREAKVPIVSRSECLYTYGWESISENMFCAGVRDGRVDTCSGDSGGPILCPINERWTVFGVTSFGDQCGRVGRYGIYAKVSNYISWIIKIIEANE